MRTRVVGDVGWVWMSRGRGQIASWPSVEAVQRYVVELEEMWRA